MCAEMAEAIGIAAIMAGFAAITWAGVWGMKRYSGRRPARRGG